VYFAPHRRVHWEFGTRLRDQKTRMMRLPGWGRSWRYIQPSRCNAPTWQTDGRTDEQQTYIHTDGHRATAKTVLAHSVAQ